MLRRELNVFKGYHLKFHCFSRTIFIDSCFFLMWNKLPANYYKGNELSVISMTFSTLSINEPTHILFVKLRER